jgi:hypothetical protein
MWWDVALDAAREISRRQIAGLRKCSSQMSKTALYTLAMIGDLGLAYFFYQNGRTVIPIILVFAALCFAIAAIGSVLGKGGPKT